MVDTYACVGVCMYLYVYGCMDVVACMCDVCGRGYTGARQSSAEVWDEATTLQLPSTIHALVKGRDRVQTGILGTDHVMPGESVVCGDGTEVVRVVDLGRKIVYGSL